jgi:hypothetical protein
LQVVAASLFLLLGKNLPQSGLSQGLSLAPILFLFFNANLVQMAIEEGASTGIVDDYTVWVVSSSFKLNTRIIRREILPQLERWERESVAVLESSKTASTHFTENNNLLRDSDMSLLSEIEYSQANWPMPWV